MLKKYIILLMASVFILSSCLKEDPPFASDKIYETEEGMLTASTGIFQALAHFNYFGSDYWHLTNLYSGLLHSKKPGDIATINKLNVPANLNYNDNVWRRSYEGINRSNTFINNVASREELNVVEYNELGQVYFLRSYLYFNLVRLWGKVPLKIQETTAATLFTERTERAKVYEQIIADARKSIESYNLAEGYTTNGRPSKYAAHMLLAKVYMTLADADIDAASLNQDEILPYLGLTSSECWALAETEALEVYNSGEFELLNDYKTLWLEETRNSKEALFEIQYNTEYAYSGKVWNINKSYKGGAGWARMGVTGNAIDQFIRANMDSDIDAPSTAGKITINGGDPRYAESFKTDYILYSNKKLKLMYPNDKLKNTNFYPVVEKYAIKNLEQDTDATNKNMTIYRYADLLLMLAEISNELDKPADYVTYLNMVIDRARNSSNGDGVLPLAIADQGKDANREEIFLQYRFELFGEGQDVFTNRRKGFDWFNNHTIIPHNNRNATGEHFTPLSTDPQKTMLLPIPLSEINTNQKISIADQNPGY